MILWRVGIRRSEGKVSRCFIILFDSANRMQIVEIPVYPVLWQNTYNFKIGRITF
jgi:hypothetical protein